MRIDPIALCKHSPCIFYSSTVFVIKTTSHTDKRTNSKCLNISQMWNLKLELYPFLFRRQTKLFAYDHSAALVSVLQESPGRPASGSPRPAGRAGQTNVTSGSPMAAVKKPDPNMKGNYSESDFNAVFPSLASLPYRCTQTFHLNSAFVWIQCFDLNKNCFDHSWSCFKVNLLVLKYSSAALKQ